MISFTYYDSPIGTLQIGYEENSIISIGSCAAAGLDIPSPVSDAAKQQLQEYFAKTRTSFDLPLNPQGTPFQRAVWKCISDIPYGEVRTYGQIAAAIGNPNASRAVGQAANKNPLWIVIPCHRVVGSNHDLTGYAGGLHMKKILLDLEKSE